MNRRDFLKYTAAVPLAMQLGCISESKNSPNSPAVSNEHKFCYPIGKEIIVVHFDEPGQRIYADVLPNGVLDSNYLEINLKEIKSGDYWGSFIPSWEGSWVVEIYNEKGFIDKKVYEVI